jgi:TPR repeat protein
LGNSGAACNIATVHRDLGDLRSAHRWAVRAMEMGDGDAAVTVGYNYLYGIGVRRNPGAARRLFHKALRANTSEHGREEALYNLAIADVDNGKRASAIQLLKRANKDGDYPEAKSLSSQLQSKADLTPCRCRRHLRKSLHGHAPCPQHPASLRRALKARRMRTL